MVLMVPMMAGVSTELMAETLNPDGSGGAWGPDGHYSSDGSGGLWGPDGHYNSDGSGGVWAPDGRHLSKDGSGGFFGPDKKKEDDDNGFTRQHKHDDDFPAADRESSKASKVEIFKSCERKAWLKSRRYSTFKTGTISKSENENAEKYNERYKIKERKAMDRWSQTRRGKNALAGCYDLVVTEELTSVDTFIQRKQDEVIEKNVNLQYNKNQGSGKPADTGPIRKEKKNGVWKFSN
jgi:hypothetical protein